MSSYYYICVLILLYMCLHSTMYVSSYYYVCAACLVGLVISSVSSNWYLLYVSYIYVLILLYMCPHSTIYVSSYCYTALCSHGVFVDFSFLVRFFLCPLFLACSILLLWPLYVQVGIKKRKKLPEWGRGAGAWCAKLPRRHSAAAAPGWAWDAMHFFGPLLAPPPPWA